MGAKQKMRQANGTLISFKTTILLLSTLFAVGCWGLGKPVPFQESDGGSDESRENESSLEENTSTRSDTASERGIDSSTAQTPAPTGIDSALPDAGHSSRAIGQSVQFTVGMGPIRTLDFKGWMVIGGASQVSALETPAHHVRLGVGPTLQPSRKPESNHE